MHSIHNRGKAANADLTNIACKPLMFVMSVLIIPSWGGLSQLLSFSMQVACFLFTHLQEIPSSPECGF